jgi:hypothetical protein
MGWWSVEGFLLIGEREALAYSIMKTEMHGVTPIL